MRHTLKVIILATAMVSLYESCAAQLGDSSIVAGDAALDEGFKNAGSEVRLADVSEYEHTVLRF
jgi:hypothetical protein